MVYAASFRDAALPSPDTSSGWAFAAKKTILLKQNKPLKDNQRQEPRRQRRLQQQQREAAKLHDLQQQVREVQAQLALLKKQPEGRHQIRTKEMRARAFDCALSPTVSSTLTAQQSAPLLESTTQIGSYRIGKLLGEGGYGKVYEATRTITDRRTNTTRQVTFALKKIEKRRMLTLRGSEDLKQELQIMQRIRHPNVVRCYQVLDGRDHIHVVLNKASMDLYDYKAKYRLTQSHIKVAMTGIMRGLGYLHMNGISHLDIKPENVLLLRDVPPYKLQAKDVQLCDFGLAVQQEDANTNSVRGWKGTFCFMAPELVTVEKAHGPSADMWSCGVTLMELLSGKMPSGWPMDRKSHLDDYKDRIMEVLHHTHARARRHNSSGWDLICRLLKWVPQSRLTAREALKHDWMRGI